MNDSNIIVVMHRYGGYFFGGYINFQKVIDHQKHQVIYFVNENGRRDIEGLIPNAKQVNVIPNMNDRERVTAAFAEVISEFGRVDHLVAMSEFDLDTAAFLRTKYDIPGMQEEQVQLFRDKVKMKERLVRDHIRVPKFLDFTSLDEVLAFGKDIGYPLILKPKDGAGSIGVKLIASQEEMEAVWPEIDVANYECEEFVAGTIFHIDGLMWNKEPAFLSVSKYVNSCFDFSQGRPSGSVLINDNAELRAEVTDFAQAALASLGLEKGCFHLELIYQEGEGPVFLEVGARTGGAEIPYVALELFGVHLCEEAIRMELGTFTPLSLPSGPVYGGFLQFPSPIEVPAEIVSVTKLQGVIPQITHERTPEVGEILDGTGLYYHLSGTYRFRGDSDDEVEEAIHRTIDMFKIESRKVDAVAGRTV